MSQWTATDTNANSAPEHSIIAGSAANGAAMYANGTFGSFNGANLATVGVYGVDVTEARTANGVKVSHAGWNVVKRGSGQVVSFNLTAGGTLYSNTNVLLVSNGVSNAVLSINTHANGTIESITGITNGGRFVHTGLHATAFVNSTFGTTGNGSGATATVTIGGRAGRIQYETLVAMGMANTANGSGAIPGVNAV